MRKQVIHAALLALLVLAACKKDEPGVPTLSAVGFNQVKQNSARCFFDVTGDGGSAVEYSGIYWGPTPNPRTTGARLEQRINVELYAVELTGLVAGTTYYVQGFAKNGVGEGYGEEASFTTTGAVQPELTAGYPGRVTPTAITCGGTLSWNGGTPTACGLCCSTSANPTTADARQEGIVTSGAFSQTLAGLEPNTTYHVRVYASNLVGTVYGPDMLVRTMCSTVTDADGNTYQTVLIGTQEWLAENLRVTHYRNGDPILNITDATQWEYAGSGAWCVYKNKSANAAKYGLLYNHKAVRDSRGLCPSGWRVPTDAEWTTLTDYLGGLDVAGSKMKCLGIDPNSDNSSGFGAILCGLRYCNGPDFSDLNYNTCWWSSTCSEEYYYYVRELHRDEVKIWAYSTYQRMGLSVRCVKD